MTSPDKSSLFVNEESKLVDGKMIDSSIYQKPEMSVHIPTLPLTMYVVLENFNNSSASKSPCSDIF